MSALQSETHMLDESVHAIDGGVEHGGSRRFGAA
jgi:hypothetical protein